MLRRSFLLCGAAPMLSAYGDHPCAAPSVFPPRFQNRFRQLDLRQIPDLDLGLPRRFVPRRSWRDWKPWEWDRLRNGYRYLIPNALSMADRRQGLLIHAWWHGHFCSQHPHDLTADGDINDVHHTWAFLPWHRALTYLHERLLAQAVRDDDFRLPVWDWDRGDDVPDFYRNFRAPFVSGPPRKPRVGVTFDDCRLRAWLVSSDFQSFVGQRAPSGLNGAEVGAHSTVHGLLCGAMKDLEVAAIDPVFYLHHANVDRFWLWWGTQYGYPAPQEWLDKYLYFPDLSGNLGKIQVSRLTPAGLRYGYADRPTVSLSGTTLSDDLLNLSISGFVPQIVHLLASSYTALVPFLAALSPEVLRTRLNALRPLDRSMLTPVDIIRVCFAGQMASLKFPIRSNPRMQTGQFYLVGVRKAQSQDDLITIGEFAIFGHVPQCFLATGCIQGSDVVKLFQLLTPPIAQLELMYGTPKIDALGRLFVNPHDIAGGSTAFCGPVQLIQFEASLNIARTFLQDLLQ